MKTIKIADYLLLLIFVYFITYNTVFGWNKLPVNEAEILCDSIRNVLLVIWFLIYTVPLHGLYINAIKKMEEEKKYKL